MMNRQTQIYQSWPTWKRLQAAMELYRLAKEIIQTRERKLHPNLSEQNLEKRVRSFFK